MASYARYLYLPEDGTRLSSSIVASIEDALRDAGLAVGPDGEGTHWRPFRPAGALQQYAERLGVVYPILRVDWFDDPHSIQDPFLPPRGPWSRCPKCEALLPSDGVKLSQNNELIIVESCESCGTPFDAYSWDQSEDRVVFRSRLIVGLTGDQFRESIPTFHEGLFGFHPSHGRDRGALPERSLRDLVGESTLHQ